MECQAADFIWKNLRSGWTGNLTVHEMAISSVFTCTSPVGLHPVRVNFSGQNGLSFLWSRASLGTVCLEFLRACSTPTDKYVQPKSPSCIKNSLLYELCLCKGFSNMFVSTPHALPIQVCQRISSGHFSCSMKLLTGIISSLFTKCLAAGAGQKGRLHWLTRNKECISLILLWFPTYSCSQSIQ